MSRSIEVPTSSTPISLDLSVGKRVVFVGANGTGKTRLGVYIEETLKKSVHRIAAQRSIQFDDDVQLTSFNIAINRMRFGYEQDRVEHRRSNRWGGKPEVQPLNDFRELLKSLYAQNNDLNCEYTDKMRINPLCSELPPSSAIVKLKSIWEKLLPQRKLKIGAANVEVENTTSDLCHYSASNMSDGERVIFYMIGQAMLAEPETVLLIDEPELHINKAILDSLWDELETSRQDCTFIYITHDIDFAASRHEAEKYVFRGYTKVGNNEHWDIEKVENVAGIPEDVVSKIAGSRKPVLFVEGGKASLDKAIYDCVYNDFTVIHVGSCGQVIHTVSTFKENRTLHRIGCAGVIDADGRETHDSTWLEKMNVYVLPVSEIENVLLVPKVFQAIANEFGFSDGDAEEKTARLKTEIMNGARNNIDRISLVYTKRRVDSLLKKIGLESKTIDALQDDFTAKTTSINPRTIFEEVKNKILGHIETQEYEKVLLYCDDKGFVARAASLLEFTARGNFDSFLKRKLTGNSASRLIDALRECLPNIAPREW